MTQEKSKSRSRVSYLVAGILGGLIGAGAGYVTARNQFEVTGIHALDNNQRLPKPIEVETRALQRKFLYELDHHSSNTIHYLITINSLVSE